MRENGPAGEAPVRAKVALVEPGTMRVVWLNESAMQTAADAGAGAPSTIEQVVPMAESLGLPEALRHVSATGEPRHLQADLISTVRGSMAMVTSVYRLPDGMLLVVTENAWQSGRDEPGAPRHGRPRRR